MSLVDAKPPDGVTVELRDAELRLRLRWRTGRSWAHLFMSFVLFCVPVPVARALPLLALLLLAIAAAYLYRSLAGLLNHTTFAMGPTLTTSVAPIPFVGAGPFRVDRIESIRAVREPHGRRRRSTWGLVVHVDGSDHVLLRAHDDRVAVSFIAERLEAHLPVARTALPQGYRGPI